MTLKMYKVTVIIIVKGLQVMGKALLCNKACWLLGIMCREMHELAWKVEMNS